MYGLSKTFGLAGLQIGWLVATNKEIMEGVQRVAGDLIQGTSSIGLAVAHAVLTKCDGYIPPLVGYLQGLRDYGVKRLSAMDGVTVESPERARTPHDGDHKSLQGAPPFVGYHALHTPGPRAVDDLQYPLPDLPNPSGRAPSAAQSSTHWTRFEDESASTVNE